MRVVRRSCRWMAPMVDKYFRHEVRGMEHVPAGQTLLVSHHDGGVLPMNGLCFGKVWYDYFPDRPLYVLSHEFLHMFGARFAKLLEDSGVIRADRSHMNGALATGASVMVFPGAARETFRPFWKRKEIDLGGRRGFVAQAIRWGLPITPIASAGAHETLIVLARGGKFAELMGIPKIVRSADVWPVLAGFPWGLWALPFVPHIPLPAKITSEVLPPIRLGEELGMKLRPEDADDKAIVEQGFQLVLGRIQSAVDRLYAERKWPFLG